MKFDKKMLFAGLRAHFGAFNVTQVEVVEAIVDEFVRRDLADLRWLAYMLATAWGECGWKPVAEIGRGKGKRYGKMINGKVYYGRGLVQLTWEENYRKMGQLLNLPLVQDPDMALQVPVAVAIMFEGMINGRFAGDKQGKRYTLDRYFNKTTDDPVNARRIINGTDKAAIFARWHYQILAVLKVAHVEEAAPAPVPPVADVPAPAPAPKPAPDLPQLDLPDTAESTGASVLLTLVIIAAVIGLGLLVVAAQFIGE